jgi:hypothetical protein
VTKYDVSIATGRAHIEVEWDNIEHLPKVVLNGKQIPPSVPGFNKTPWLKQLDCYCVTSLVL